MKIYYPSYYDLFRCTAGECEDTCCAKWQIVIDDETYDKYMSLQGVLSDKIRECIVDGSDNEKYFRLENARCPFLNSENLCEIHKSLGEGYTSSVCRQHPRFIEEYDGFTEISLSLSCPEANRVLFDIETVDSYNKPDYYGDDEVLELLISSRDTLLNKNLNIFDFFRILIITSADDQLDIDLVYVDSIFEITVEQIKSYISFIYNNCEILTDQWNNMLEAALNSDCDFGDLHNFIEVSEAIVFKGIRYFIYRYYLKAVNDLDVYSRALFILMSVIASSYFALTCKISFQEAIRIYSKEIEHNLDNVERIIDYFRDF